MKIQTTASSTVNPLEKKLLMVLHGATGTGKTPYSLYLATKAIEKDKENNTLIGNGKILLIDTEATRGLNYAAHYDFEHLAYTDHVRANYTEHGYRLGHLMDLFKYLYEMPDDTKYSAVIIDSLTSFWVGNHGAIAQANSYKKGNSNSVNPFAGWGPVTDALERIYDIVKLIAIKTHFIATLRAKQSYLMIDNKPVLQGESPEFRKDYSYHFDLISRLDKDCQFQIEKATVPYHSSLSGFTIAKQVNKGVKESWDLYIDRVARIIINYLDVDDLKAADELRSAIGDLARTKNIPISSLAKKVKDLGYTKSIEMPVDDLRLLYQWVEKQEVNEIIITES